MKKDPILEIQGLSIGLPCGGDRRYAVEDMTCTLHSNEILCVVGESGSGKSVFARSIMRLLAPKLNVLQGSIQFSGTDLLKASQADMRKVRGRQISMIFQEPMTALNPLIKIGVQMEEVLCIHVPHLSRAARTALMTERLERVGIADPIRLQNSYPHELSGGQRQRAMIAMALLLEPQVLIADEPTTALDVTTQAKILGLIKDIQRTSEMGVIFITHDFGVVAELADRVAVMKTGQLVELGETRQVLENPSHPYTQGLIAAVPKMKLSGTSSIPGHAPVVLDVKGVRKSYRRGGRGEMVHALRDVSLSIRRGETVGIVGESGSGKSTMAKCVARLVHADAGEISIDGIDVLRLSKRQLRQARSSFQMVFQDPFASLDPRWKVGMTIAESLLAHGVAEEEAMRRAHELLQLVGLKQEAADRFPHEFSGGQRQRIAIARALALSPKLLIADEPVSALDVSVQAQILRLLADIKSRLNLAMLFITHDLRVASHVCDSVCVMKNGEIVERGNVQEVFSNPRHAYTRELLSAVPGLGQEIDREPLPGIARATPEVLEAVSMNTFRIA